MAVSPFIFFSLNRGVCVCLGGGGVHVCESKLAGLCLLDLSDCDLPSPSQQSIPLPLPHLTPLHTILFHTFVLPFLFKDGFVRLFWLLLPVRKLWHSLTCPTVAQ